MVKEIEHDKGKAIVHTASGKNDGSYRRNMRMMMKNTYDTCADKNIEKLQEEAKIVIVGKFPAQCPTVDYNPPPHTHTLVVQELWTEKNAVDSQ